MNKYKNMNQQCRSAYQRAMGNQHQSSEIYLLFKVVDLFSLYQHWPGSFYLMGHLQQLAQILSDPEN